MSGQGATRHVVTRAVDEEATRQRQAVVVIHGIGEQRPMDTLRAFMDGLGLSDYYSKPDRISGSLEHRRLTLRAVEDERPLTDFYELYWAHHFRRGSAVDTVLWALRLMFRRPGWRMGPVIGPVVTAAQALAVLVVALVAGWLIAGASFAPLDVGRLPFAQRWLWLLLAVAVVLFGTALAFLRGPVASAARYLAPGPRSLGGRTAIRRDGLALLRGLHACGDYARIVVIGHSLGSVIAYDLLHLAWDDLRYPDPASLRPQPVAESIVREGRDHVTDLHSGPDRVSSSAVSTWHERQFDLWREQRGLGVPWLVTDFISLGSPLAHAQHLIGTKVASLDRRRREREYPCAPPIPDETVGGSWLYRRQMGGSTPLVAHDGAVFGVTRWSNLYMPVRRGLVGDLVGGPVAGVFGHGVRDVPVRASYGPRWVRVCRAPFPMAHGDYWRGGRGLRDAWTRDERRAEDERLGTKEASRVLLGLMRLDVLRGSGSLPAPGAGACGQE